MTGMSLRILALGLAIAGISGNNAIQWSTEHARTVAEIEALGGSATVEDKGTHKAIVSVDLSNTAVTDAWLKCLGDLVPLQSLDLHNTKVTDAGLMHLKGLKNLQSLDLALTKVTGAGLECLHNLRTLDLSASYVTNATLEHSSRT